MVTQQLPYCGAPPDPASLLQRFNWDPYLIVALVALTVLQCMALRGDRSARWR